jgi:hypothetical protein
MMHIEDFARLETISAAATGVLTMAEGLERAELDGSRITRREISRLLLVAADAVSALSSEARAALVELDVRAWQLTAERLRAGGDTESDARWFATHALAPATLGWLDFYRSGAGALTPTATT